MKRPLADRVEHVGDWLPLMVIDAVVLATVVWAPWPWSLSAVAGFLCRGWTQMRLNGWRRAARRLGEPCRRNLAIGWETRTKAPGGAAVAPYKPALTLGAMVGLVVFVAVVTGSPAVVICIVLVAAICCGIGWVYGVARGRKAGRYEMARHVASADQLVRQMQADHDRIGQAVEDLATRWEAYAPVIPYTCVRDLRDLVGAPQQGVNS